MTHQFLNILTLRQHISGSSSVEFISCRNWWLGGIFILYVYIPYTISLGLTICGILNHVQRQSSSITTASPFYFTSMAMQYTTWSYKLTYSTRSLVRKLLVIARYPLVNYCTQSVSLSMLSACWIFFQYVIPLLARYLLVSILSAR